jgi:nucleotide-binding universal stress UspA family protein
MSNFAPKSILCLVDLSLASQTVLRWASLFAGVYRARVEVLHAEWFEYPPYFLPSQTQELSEVARRNRELLHESLAKLIVDNFGKDIPYQITILEGHPVQTVLNHAAKTKPDLIVMGSHGRRGLARMRLGSVAEDVVQQAGLPTLVVRAPESKPVPAKLSRVLCPVNFSEQSKQNLALSAEVASAFGAQLLVMHAEEEGRSPAMSQKQLCDWVPRDARGHCELLEVVRQGNAAEQILMAAHEHSVDIITLSAMHRRFLDFTVIGTTTERVMRHADTAVLVHPAGIEAAK